jgi:holin-like protein
MLHFQRMGDEWRPIVVALIASTLLAIGVTALVMRALTRHDPAHMNSEQLP